MSVVIQKLAFYGLVILCILIFMLVAAGMFWYFNVYKKRRRWNINVFEEKSDGKLALIGKDVLEERTRSWGTKSFYFLKKRKRVAMPPPDGVVSQRINGKEEVDYVQIERQLFPCDRKVTINTSDKEVNLKLQKYYDNIINGIYNTKDKKILLDKYIYIPVSKTIKIPVNFKPIPYDVQLTAARQVDMHREFFAKKGNFWEKYGGVIMVVMVGVIVLLCVYLSYDFLTETMNTILGKADATIGALDKIASSLGTQSAPPA